MRIQKQTRRRSRLPLPLGLCALCLALTVGAGSPCRASSIALRHTTAAGIPVLILQADMNSPHVKVTGMVTQNGHAELFGDMVARSHPAAAVTGTFFSPESLVPIGDIVIDGSLACRGGVGTGLCIKANNDVDFVMPPHRYANMDWSPYDFVCASGPRLVVNGKVQVHPQAEGFHDPHLLGRACRLAVGITGHNKLLFVATRARIRLETMAHVMQKLGCVDAVNLDAGSSQGVYYRGKTWIKPHRKLTNLILIYDDRQRYEQFKEALAPALTPASKSQG